MPRGAAGFVALNHSFGVDGLCKVPLVGVACIECKSAVRLTANMEHVRIQLEPLFALAATPGQLAMSLHMHGLVVHAACHVLMPRICPAVT